MLNYFQFTSGSTDRRLNCFAIYVLTIGVGFLVAAQSVAATDHFDGLRARLIKDGFGPDYVHTAYGDPGALFDVDTASFYFVQRESKMNYNRFLEDAPVNSAASYLEKFKPVFQDVEARYPVPKEIIAGILLVETRFGRVTGNRSVLNTLSTLSALGDRKNRKYLFTALREKRIKVSPKRVSKWADRKSDWAYRELKAYLTYTDKNEIDPVAMRGSYAGAFGFAQFLPSSVLRYGRDGNGDGKCDLFTHPDAIESIACYLQKHGWKENMSREDMTKTLFCYNRSTYYVDTILSVADKLKERR